MNNKDKINIDNKSLLTFTEHLEELRQRAINAIFSVFGQRRFIFLGNKFSVFFPIKTEYFVDLLSIFSLLKISFSIYICSSKFKLK